MRQERMVGLAAMLMVLAIVAWSFPVPSLHPKMNSRVFQGKIPARGQFKSLVMLMVNGRPGCTGSIISANFVLTARHCFSEIYHMPKHHPELLKPEFRYILLITGVSPKTAVSENLVKAEDVQVRKASFKNIFLFNAGNLDRSHECHNTPPYCNKDNTTNCHLMACDNDEPKTCEYTNQCKALDELLDDDPNDIALVKLDEPFTFNDFVGPLPLLGNGDTSGFLSTDCFGVGYGLYDSDSNVNHDDPVFDLFYVDVKCGGSDYCSSLFKWSTFTWSSKRWLISLFKKAICSTGEKQVCPGDSGGPLICKIQGTDVVVGALSHGLGYGTFEETGHKPCEHNKLVAVYASTSSFVAWIKKVTAGEDVEFVSSSASASTWLGSYMWLLLLLMGMIVLLNN